MARSYITLVLLALGGLAVGAAAATGGRVVLEPDVTVPSPAFDLTLSAGAAVDWLVDEVAPAADERKSRKSRVRRPVDGRAGGAASTRPVRRDERGRRFDGGRGSRGAEGGSTGRRIADCVQQIDHVNSFTSLVWVGHKVRRSTTRSSALKQALAPSTPARRRLRLASLQSVTLHKCT